MPSPTRRRFLAAATAGTLAAVSGCLGGSASTGGRQSADDEQSSDGHDVQSSFFVAGDLARHVAGKEATVSDLVPFGQHGHGWEPGPRIQRAVVDADAFVYVGEGFQPWADDIVANLASDAPDLPVVAVREGIDLLPAPGSDAHDEEEHHDEEHNDSHETETTHADEHGEDDHDHGTADPHFWLDPQRAKQAAMNVRDAFTDFDPANGATYETNAESFAADLDALDAEFEETLADRDRDVVLVAGHNAFQYLAARYGFEVHALVGLAPDATPSPQAIREAQAVIDRHDIEHVLTPVFESDRAATQLVEETDATATLPVTPIPTLTPEWAEQGWGYLDVMREVNLDSLATALGAK